MSDTLLDDNPPLRNTHKDAVALFDGVAKSLVAAAAYGGDAGVAVASVLFDIPAEDVTEKQAYQARLIMHTLGTVCGYCAKEGVQ